jgi:hypothetical protein
MPVVFQVNGSPVATTTTTIAVPWPAHSVNDVALLFVTSSGGNTSTSTLATANGFTMISDTSTGTGTAGARLSIFWARASSSSMAAPVLSTGTDFKFAFISTFRGVKSSGNPYSNFNVATKATASTTASFTTINTTASYTMVVQAIATDVSSTSPFVSSYANGALSNLTERFDSSVVTGSGGGISFATSELAISGATGATTATVASSINAMTTILLIPEPTQIISNTFDGGTDGALITTANSGGVSGTPIESRSSNVGTTLAFSSSKVRSGLSLKMNALQAGAGYVNFTYISSSRTVIRYYFYFEDSIDEGYYEVGKVRNSANANLIVVGMSGRNMNITVAGGAISTVPVKIQPDNWYRLEYAFNKGTATNNGRAEFYLYDGDSLSPIHTFTSTTANMGTTDAVAIRIGAASGPANGPQVTYFDDFIAQELDTGLIGPSQPGTNYNTNQFFPFF